MPNAIDYIDWRGDIPLSVSPLNGQVNYDN